jgi:sporadic carbohydrate cluster 2OG-Fe(II) oxygenase
VIPGDDLGDAFLRCGFVVRDVADKVALGDVADFVLAEARGWVTRRGGATPLRELSTSHSSIPTAHVNELRLAIFAALNARITTRPQYFSLARPTLEMLVGNELAMQTKVNLSIQQPDDPGSVLDIHSDVWTGDSPFQVVLWVPLTDTTGTNAMFFLPPEPSYEAYRRVRAGELRSMAEVRAAYDSQISVIEMKVGQVLVFNSNCLHGNQLNTTTTSRWSLNSRFVNLLAPATNPERRLGSYYTPLTVRPATRMGLRAIELMGLGAGGAAT